jgi:hypothetical protein
MSLYYLRPYMSRPILVAFIAVLFADSWQAYVHFSNNSEKTSAVMQTKLRHPQTSTSPININRIAQRYYRH